MDFLGLFIEKNEMNIYPGGGMEQVDESNCLGYAMTGKSDQYRAFNNENKGPNDLSAQKDLENEGWNCSEVTHWSGCKCPCEQVKMIVSAFLKPEGETRNPWTDPTFPWDNQNDVVDLHAIRSEPGCSAKGCTNDRCDYSQKYTEVPNVSHLPQDKQSVDSDTWNNLFTGKKTFIVLLPRQIIINQVRLKKIIK